MFPWRMLYGPEAPWAAPDFADHGQGPLLALRMVLLLLAASSLADTAGATDSARRGAVLRFGAVAALVTLSLLARIFFLPAALGASLIVVSWPGLGPRLARVARLGTPLAVVLALGAGPLLSRARAEAGSDDPLAGEAWNPPRATTRALERGNLYEARYWAEQWARLETDDPRQGTLIWARVEQQAGHDARARRLAADVVARGRSPVLRAQAQQMLTTLPAAP